MNWNEAKTSFLSQYRKVQQIKKEIEQNQEAQTEIINEKEKLKEPISVDQAMQLTENSEFQLARLWFNNDFREEQAHLFYEAMNLRKAFIVMAAQSQQGKIISQAVNIWKNRSKVPDDKIIAVQNAFEIIQLIIPVISSTFASIQSFFKQLGKNSIDNLFIDEAGQALPIQAIGAIWRAKKVLAVGDPLQITPVQPIDSYLLSLIAKSFDIDVFYTGQGASVQRLADRACPIGTELSSGWIGIPLWVHRRCSEPMFSISNQISYENKMVQGVQKSVGIGYWFDVKGTAEIRQFVPAQLEVLSDEIQRRLNYNKDKLSITLQDIYVISSFSIIASEIVNIRHPRGISMGEFKKWQKDNVGTVHKFQGKEAKVVFFILGADEASQSSIDWAVSTPNLLNVAATRAEKEFYIIGDKDLFSNKQNLDIANDFIDKLKPESDSSYGKLLTYMDLNIQEDVVLGTEIEEINIKYCKLWQSKEKDKIRLYLYSEQFKNGEAHYDFNKKQWFGIEEVLVINQIEKQIANGGEFDTIVQFIQKYYLA